MNPQSNEPTNKKTILRSRTTSRRATASQRRRRKCRAPWACPCSPTSTAASTTRTPPRGGDRRGRAAKQLKADATTTFASAAAVADAAGEVLDFYNESYGSLANFSVMCPGDATWQRTVAGLVGDVVATGSAGVYIDQASEASRQSKN